MQGQQGKTVSFTETLEIDRASSSSRKGPPETHLTGFMLSPDNIRFMGSLGENRSLGEASSSNGLYTSNIGVWKSEDGGLSNAARHGPRIEDQLFGPSNGVLSSDNAGNNPLFVEGCASSSIPQRIDSRGECVHLFKYGDSNSNQIFPTRSGNQVYPSIPSATGGYIKEANGVRLVSSLDCRSVPCKRKSFEEYVGPSSIIQNSNFPQPMASNLRYTTPPCLNMNALPATQQLPEQLGHGLSFNIAGDAGARGVPNTESSETLHRNFQLRINSSAQNDLTSTPLSTPALVSNGNPGVGLAPLSSSRVLVANRSLELPHPTLFIGPASQGPRPLVQVPVVVPGGHTDRLRIHSAAQNDLTSTPLSTPALASNVGLAPESSLRVPVANHSLELQTPSLSSGPASPGPRPSVQVPVVVPRGHSARWTRAAPRNVSSSGAVIPNESTSSDNSRNMLQHSVFASNSSSSSARGLATASTSSFRGHLNSAPGGSSSSAVPRLPHHSLAPQPNHHHSRYPQRIIGAPRQLSTIGSDPRRAQSSQVSNTLGRAVPPQDVLLSSASGQNTAGHRHSLSRSAIGMGRQGDSVVRSLYPVRTFSAREGPRILASEIRNALELLRRGDGNIWLEDVMSRYPSMFWGVADLYDRHRDMRLDVDNMSYEELLALEERIGNVCTGLNEETILTLMKQRKYSNMEKTKMEVEPCCVCQEESDEGEDLGTLECGHDFHRDCIKQWLMQKNLCPICKTTGLST